MTISLADKIAGTAPSGVLKLPAGEYVGNIVIDRPITIQGTGRSTWIAARSSPVIQIRSAGVTLRDIEVAALDANGVAATSGVAIAHTPGAAPQLERVSLAGTVSETAASDLDTVPAMRIRLVPPPPLEFADPPPNEAARQQAMTSVKDAAVWGDAARAVERAQTAIEPVPAPPSAIKSNTTTLLLLVFAIACILLGIGSWTKETGASQVVGMLTFSIIAIFCQIGVIGSAEDARNPATFLWLSALVSFGLAGAAWAHVPGAGLRWTVVGIEGLVGLGALVNLSETSVSSVSPAGTERSNATMIACLIAVIVFILLGIGAWLKLTGVMQVLGMLGCAVLAIIFQLGLYGASDDARNPATVLWLSALVLLGLAEASWRYVPGADLRWTVVVVAGLFGLLTVIGALDEKPARP